MHVQYFPLHIGFVFSFRVLATPTLYIKRMYTLAVETALKDTVTYSFFFFKYIDPLFKS
jgi:hypothetical protein